MSNVFIVDTNKQPLDTLHPARARILLSRGKAAVLKRYPFTIILKVAVDDLQVAELRVKLDPGSKTTGIAIVNDTTGEIVFAAELTHRGQSIKKSLDDRRARRHGRRARHMRYRQPRWQNRRRASGWLPPSLQSRISNVITWVRRFMRMCHITNISMELVKFGMQAMEHAEISGVEYQQGTLTGDLVKAIVPKHLKTAGTHEGRMSAKAVGSFTIATKSGTVPDVGKQYCRVVQRADGYGYSQRSA